MQNEEKNQTDDKDEKVDIPIPKALQKSSKPSKNQSDDFGYLLFRNRSTSYRKMVFEEITKKYPSLYPILLYTENASILAQYKNEK